MADTSNPDHAEDGGGEGGETRRDILTYTVGAFGVIGVASVAWPFIDSMNPAADTLAVSTVEIDLSPVEPGQAITVMWRGSPVFVRRRTDEEITAAEQVSLDDFLNNRFGRHYAGDDHVLVEPPEYDVPSADGPVSA